MNIQSADGTYAVEFVSTQSQLLDRLGGLNDAFLILDRHVGELYPWLAAPFPADRVLLVDATEDEKTLAGVERVCLFLQQNGASRKSRLIVAGGGILQDIGTFCAHIFYRGIPYVYVPTTLLSMADSCIGAKCAVNLGAYKNQLGFFQSPEAVVQWPGFLATLDADDVRSGYGEILKLSIVGGKDRFAEFRAHIDRHGFAIDRVEPMIRLALEVKKPIIEEDEFDRGVRKTLNYGHTFGHALESVTDHEVPHGLAVAWGVDLANFVARSLGRWSDADFDEVHDIVAQRFAIAPVKQIDALSLVGAMAKDKKAAGSTVQTILPNRDWKLEVVPQQLGGALEHIVSEYVTARTLA
jgi:3-dehydroquinate synthase